MKKLDLLKIGIICAIVGMNISCKDKNQFTIKGEVAEAEGKTLYFENVGVSQVTILDSIKLKGKGAFEFEQHRPEAPDFYRLRLNGQLINVSVDSTETIDIHASAALFAKDYTVEGSTDCQTIKEMTLLQLKTSEAYNRLQESYNTKAISSDEYVQKAKEVIDGYKDAARKVIYSNPKSGSAYFALFQQINGLLIFDPYDKDDYKAFGAVATSWNQYYPDANRSKHLYNLALNALKTIRGERPIQYSEANEKALFDITLPDINGKEVELNTINQGKVTLVDFIAYQMEASPLHNRNLAIVYEKYKAQGFEIYQVSLDSDEHFWKNAAVNLPWICVRDPKSIYSKVAGTYNVKDLPTGFIFNKNGEVVKRLESYESLEKDVISYLK